MDPGPSRLWDWYLPAGGLSLVLGLSGCRALGVPGLMSVSWYVMLGLQPLVGKAMSRDGCGLRASKAASLLLDGAVSLPG